MYKLTTPYGLNYSVDLSEVVAVTASDNTCLLMKGGYSIPVLGTIEEWVARVEEAKANTQSVALASDTVVGHPQVQKRPKRNSY